MRTSYPDIAPRTNGGGREIDRPSKSTICESSSLMTFSLQCGHLSTLKYADVPQNRPTIRTEFGHKNTRQVTPWGVLPGGRNLPRFFLWIGTDNHRRTPYGVTDGWEIVEMRGIEPRSDVASTGLLRAQFMRTLLFGSGTCINTYTDEPSHVKVPPAPATRASSSGLLSRCR